MKTPFPFLSTLFCLMLLWVVSCKKEDPVVPPGGTTGPGSTTGTTTTKSSAKAITAFSFNSLSPAVTGTIDATAKTISATVASGTDVTKLVPTITVSDKATVSPVSGVTQDFSKAVTYTVTAEDGSTQAYTVSVMKESTNTASTANDVLFICGTDDKKLYAIDASTGTKKWEYLTDGVVYSSPIYADGVVFFGGGDKKLLAIDASTGAKKWEFSGPNGFTGSAPTYSDKIIYIPDSFNRLYAIDATTGTKKWEFSGADILTNAVVENGTVYASARNRRYVYAIDAATGAKKWEATTGGSYSVGEYSVAVMSGLVYTVTTNGKQLQALDAATGAKKWDFTIDGNTTSSSPTVSNGVVYITDWTQSLYAIDATTGTKKWKYTANELSYDPAGPVVQNGVVYVGLSVAVDAATGQKKWNNSVGTKYDVSSVLANGVLFGGSISTKTLYAVDAATGAKKWEFLVGSNLSSSACVVDKNGKVYYGGSSGMVQ
ncbi:outer membrane protein assembly factor BamB family protein [Spirosoma validum]|uniref:PQQ-binding-like beta-propeller repeat protein n=1 Tax=Spirosoma validum TaxID=2771355 RepID=A0A927B5F6_9BACT|nr:PQQ-binding-like beta-propeller repeat protein [Spirosoma validum]MBD2755683.1 PQQ-binding-like beta-propeller repeat protein [Spirosoma validum]